MLVIHVIVFKPYTGEKADLTSFWPSHPHSINSLRRNCGCTWDYSWAFIESRLLTWSSCRHTQPKWMIEIVTQSAKITFFDR